MSLSPWKFNVDRDAFDLDIDRLIRETTAQMQRVEEENRLKIVANFLRERGWIVIPPEKGDTI